jgi:release factor glutamine methyltransferase
MSFMGEYETTVQSIADALRLGKGQLAMTRTETPSLDAEVLLRHVLGINRAELYARFPEPIEVGTLEVYRQLLTERGRGAPIAYLTGTREFMGLPFVVGPGVLVPRPETEVLVEWADAWLHDRPTATVVDVGTGSGAIALSNASRLGPHWPGRVIAADVSPVAVAIADRNRTGLGLGSQVAIVQGSLLAWTAGPIDLVLANLPYLRPDQITANPQLAAEPRLALDGGADGLELIRRFLSDAPRVLSAGGAVGLEIDPSQREAVVNLTRHVFPEAEVHVLQDLAGYDRHVTIQTSVSRPGH